MSRLLTDLIAQTPTFGTAQVESIGEARALYHRGARQSEIPSERFEQVLSAERANSVGHSGVGEPGANSDLRTDWERPLILRGGRCV
jgi:hypothetical protein